MGYGYGSVYQRSSDGIWMAVVEEPRKRGEPRKRKVLSAKTEARVRARLDAYRAEHPAPEYEALSRTELLARAREIEDHKPAEWWTRYRKGDKRCHYCRTDLRGQSIWPDHYIPLSRGGSNGIDNVVPCCQKCNQDKNRMTGDEYLAYLAIKGTQ